MPLLVFSQHEKRLALVIGNSNYDKGPLNNPVNDALLIAKTLDSLNFDVILDTNIANRGEFLKTIREFGNKRSEYDVAFVYYAGHGIQVGAENFLLPTKANFQTDYDVMDNAVSVQNIMRYLNGMTNQVNILILDACRDNPFEVNWNKTRSLKGKGLAKISPPTGSLIAFSTDAGNTAADGDGKNSVYCQALCKNMMLENTSLDQVFRNVRSDVLKETANNQRPVESSQLTGDMFYLNASNNLKNYLIIDDYLIHNELDSALLLLNTLINYFPNDKIAYTKRGHIYSIIEENDKAILDYNKALELDSLYYPAIISTIVQGNSNSETVGLHMIVDNSLRLAFYNKMLKKFPMSFDVNLFFGRFHTWNGDPSIAINVFKKLEKAVKSKTVELNSTKSLNIGKSKSSNDELLSTIYNNLGYAFQEEGSYEESNFYFKESLKIMDKEEAYGTAWALFAIGNNYFDLNDLKNADLYFTKAIDIFPLSHFIRTRARFYIENFQYEKALIDLKNARLLSLEQNQSYQYCEILTFIAGVYMDQNELIKALYYIDDAIYFEKNRLTEGSLLGDITHAHILRHMIFYKLEEDELACDDLKEIYKYYSILKDRFDEESASDYFSGNKYKNFMFTDLEKMIKNCN